MSEGANILETIAARRRERYAEMRARGEDVRLGRAAREMAAAEGARMFPFEQALRAPGMSFICECKSASPSKGVIEPDYDPAAIAVSYERAGAAAISVLTEPDWFGGSLDYLEQVAGSVRVPVLRKDFVVAEQMIFEAKLAGASAVLLICAILSDGELARLVALCHELGLSALVEAYAPEEVPRAIAAGARVVGVNNRDLRTFEVDFGRSIELRGEVGPGRVFVSESGVGAREDVAALEAAGVDAVLVGETLMRAADRRAALDALRGGPATKVKLCGLSREEDVEAVNRARPDLCGFIVDFPKSRRSVTPERMAELSALVDPGIVRVGVFVDADVELVARLAAEGAIDAAQLHGGEDGTYIERLRAAAPGLKIIQAFKVRGADDVARAEASGADIVLLDNGQGTGESFDWSLVERVRRPFMLAGGLAPGNIARAIAQVRPWGVDMSSGIETDGVKDAGKIEAAVAAVRSA